MPFLPFRMLLFPSDPPLIFFSPIAFGLDSSNQSGTQASYHVKVQSMRGGVASPPPGGASWSSLMTQSSLITQSSHSLYQATHRHTRDRDARHSNDDWRRYVPESVAQRWSRIKYYFLGKNPWQIRFLHLGWTLVFHKVLESIQTNQKPFVYSLLTISLSHTPTRHYGHKYYHNINILFPLVKSTKTQRFWKVILLILCME